MYDISLGKISNKGDFTMHTLQTLIKNYLDYCKTKKNLNKKMLKTYKIDLSAYSCSLKPEIQNLGNQSFGTRKLTNSCLIICSLL